MNRIEIWEPRYHDSVVLIHPNKVDDDNIIYFSKVSPKSALYQREFYLSGEEIKSYPRESNGTVMCYVVPLEALEWTNE